MLTEIKAFMRQDFLTQTSYRIRTLISIAGFLVPIVPVFFIANAIDPLLGDSIADQGGEYFGFLVVGLAAQRILYTAMMGLPGSVSSTIRTGTLEALFVTPIRLSTLVTGLVSYRMLWVIAEAFMLILAGTLLGADIALSRVPIALAIVVAITVTYFAFGLIGGAAMLAFRTMGPLSAVVGLSSVFLGGVFYPTEVIPSWLRGISDYIPLTYGLRALRKTLLEGMSAFDVAGDITIMLAFMVGLVAVGWVLFNQAFQYARRSGSLSQY